MSKSLIIAFLLLLGPLMSFSQDTDTLTVKKDSTVKDTSYTRKRANRAALYSAILPGAGQFYNKKYWKIPIIYGGFIALGLAIEFNNAQYKDFKQAYIYRVDGDTTTKDLKYQNIYPNDQSILVRRDYYRRSRDLMWIFTGVLYMLNIIDAYVDASLSDFDVSDKLSLRVSPSLQLSRDMQPTASMAFCLSFH